MLCGCASTPKFVAQVDSITAYDSTHGRTYFLLPGNEKISANDLYFKEYSRYIDRAMSGRGYTKVKDINSANIIVFFHYGIGNPAEKTYSYSLPIFGQTGVSSSNTYGTINSYGGTSTYSGTTTYTPTYGIVGSTTHVGSVTLYTRHLSLVAFDFGAYKKDKVLKELWKTSAISTGMSGDLRQVMPLMVTAIAPYIGSNTGQMVKVAYELDSPDVLKIKNSGNKKTP